MSSHPPATGHSKHEDIFVGHGEMARLMQGHDWASSTLGPPEYWPNALKVATRLLLTSRFEMWMGWGPDIAFLYNDAYRPTLGTKHPQALAMPTKVLWKEIWHDVEHRLKQVYERGESTWDRALLLVLERHGYPEETYHTFSYSPLLGDSGKVEGVFCAVSEETDRVISERRMASLRELASKLSSTKTREAVLAAAEQGLALNPHDLPFTLTYLFAEDGTAHLACATGIASAHPCAPSMLARENEVWNLQSIWQGNASEVQDQCALRELPKGAWDRPPKGAVLVPLIGQGGGKPLGTLVVGLNPYQLFDDGYLDFVKLLAGQMASGLASAEAYEAEQRHAQILAEAMQLRTEERDRLRDLFHQAPSFMCLLQGPDHVFALANEAYLQLTGHRNLIGLAIREGLPEIVGQGYFELLDRVYATGEPFVGRNMAVQLQRTPGSALEERYVHVTYQPVLASDGTMAGIFVDGHDVTHQKRAEDALQQLNGTLEQRVVQRTTELADALDKLKRESTEREAAQTALRQAQRMESLGALTGGVAHDFNNLLQVISGNLQLISKHVIGNENAEKRVQNAMAGVARGSKLASQLLAFGRRQPLEPKVVNIGRFIKNMDDMLRRALGEEIEVETVISGGLWNTLIDPGQIENALLNLAINARDAMNGRGKLTIEAGNALLDDEYARLHNDLQAGQHVMVAVTDTGCGIPPEIIDRVFEPFFSTKPEGKGTGLGLSMVYGFVKQSGGHIKVYSEVGEGTTIKLYLPRVMQTEDVLADTAQLPASGGTETVLVVEDDEDVRETVVATLAELGYRVFKAKDAMSALSVIESGVPIDVLFTDVVMPGPLRSPELARKARERLPHVAVLFTSGYTENAIVHGGRLDAGVELLSKPHTREALARKIRHVIGNQAQLRLATERPAANMPPAGVNATSPKLAPLRILVVEDDELVRASTAEILAEQGHLVIEATDAQSALRTLAAAPIDVLLADHGLPGLSGAELARQARSRWPDLHLIFVTGDRSGPAAAALRDAIILEKPYHPQDLCAALAQVSRPRVAAAQHGKP